jgi:hypothetical protein
MRAQRCFVTLIYVLATTTGAQAAWARTRGPDRTGWRFWARPRRVLCRAAGRAAATAAPPRPPPARARARAARARARPGAPAARLLRQANSFGAQGLDKSAILKGFSQTDNAEALAQSVSLGFAVNEITVGAFATAAGGGAVGPLGDAATGDVFERSGAAPSIAAFGAAAVSSTPGGATAVAAADSMPLAAPSGTPGTARGTTLASFDPVTLSGGGKLKNVMTSSVGTTNPAAGAFAQSDQGDGPHALASAGDAVASAYAAKLD